MPLFPKLLSRPSALPAVLLVVAGVSTLASAADTPAWRPIPLVAGHKIAKGWTHVGWGGFTVDGGALRTDCDPRGLGLLVYEKERFGQCQIRVVFKTEKPRSNAGIYVRLADGILTQAGAPGARFDRDAAGKISPASMERMKLSADRAEGPWYAVHHGYEVQIMDSAGPLHRTGAIYSLAESTAGEPRPGTWRTLLITLDGERISVDLDGRRVTGFDPGRTPLPERTQWYEPKREPARPRAGFLGLQNHDPGDVVWFREVSVRPLPAPAIR